MPYPNPYDPELLERQRFAVAQAGGDEQAGREYYERLCMRAVNQCIGRAIRHKDDYAAIVRAKLIMLLSTRQVLASFQELQTKRYCFCRRYS